MLKLFSKRKKQKVHLLHIGKTGGSAVRSVLNNHLETPKYTIKLHDHRTTLQDIPKGENVIFFLRDPVSRLISGFYSRQRKGQPLYYFEWTPQEKEAFEAFATPNELAISLANEESKDHSLAIMTMKSVQHLESYKKWFSDFEYFQSRIEDILFIGFQETLSSDFNELKSILDIPESVLLPTDDVTAHKTPKNLDKSIEESGILALHNWYSDDYKFISLCKELMSI